MSRGEGLSLCEEEDEGVALRRFVLFTSEDACVTLHELCSFLGVRYRGFLEEIGPSIAFCRARTPLRQVGMTWGGDWDDGFGKRGTGTFALQTSQSAFCGFFGRGFR